MKIFPFCRQITCNFEIVVKLPAKTNLAKSGCLVYLSEFGKWLFQRGLAEASQIIRDLEAMERNEREIHRNGHGPDPLPNPHRFINVIDPTPPGFIGPPPRYGSRGHGAGRRAPGGLNPLREQDPIRERTDLPNHLPYYRNAKSLRCYRRPL